MCCPCLLPNKYVRQGSMVQSLLFDHPFVELAIEDNFCIITWRSEHKAIKLFVIRRVVYW